MATARQAALGLYRALVRVALRMPDDHRRALVCFRTRSEFDLSRSLPPGEELEARLQEGDLYLDNLNHQATHLNSLVAQPLFIPVDIRRPPTPPNHKDKRKLIRAIWARRSSGTGRVGLGKEKRGDRFMKGPEPSWVRKREHVHTDECGHGHEEKG